MTRKIIAVLIALMLVIGAACAESAGYDVIYTSENPIPDIAERVRPAVVVVHCTTTTWDPETRLTDTLETSSGSGVYIDAKGYILTNNHIVADADDIELEWLDGTRMPAEIVGSDDGYDIAVLRFTDPVSDVQPVPVGDSDAVRIGELAIVIGNPGDSEGILYGTVTAGIISGLQRADINAGNFSRAMNVIQTDAAINTGNSGGALLNAKGELIGIPTLKMSSNETGVYESLGFAIPVNSVMPIVNSLIDSGTFSRPGFGIRVYDNDGPEEALKHYPPAGIVVDLIEPDSAAERSGLQINDVITHINGTRVHTFIEMTAILDRLAPGDTITLTVSRYYDEDGSEKPKPETVDMEIVLEQEENS